MIRFALVSAALGSLALVRVALAQAPDARPPTARPPAALTPAARTTQPPASDAVQGIVALITQPFELDLATAKELCPDPDARIRIVAVPLESATVDPLAALGSPTPTVSIDSSVRFAADDRALERRIAAATCVIVEGGNWVDWWTLVEPRYKITCLGRALRDAHARGATVIGIGAAGVYLCDRGVVSRATLWRPSRDPHDPREHVLAGGMGLVGGGCFDFAIDGRTTLEDMLDAMRTSGLRRAVWLAGPCAWIQAGDGLSARVAGPQGSAFVLDLATAQRSRESIFGGRILRLSPGERFDLDTPRVSGGTGWSGPDETGVRAADLDERLEGFPWPGPGADPRNPPIPGQAVELRGKASRLRLLPSRRGPKTAIPPSARNPDARSQQADWIRFDWIQPA